MSDSKPRAGDVFDVKRINQLIELMKEHELSEIDLRQDEQRIRLCRGTAGAPTASPPAAAPQYAPPPAASPAPPAAEDNKNIVTITSPMVGTFYARANPKAEPFVKIGSRVTAETTICIIEAMKVFNEIPAEVNGEIVAILADDEEPVEFGKPLFKVDTSR